MSMIWPGAKNEVLPPSGAVIVGFSTVTGDCRGTPLTLKTLEAGPLELNGSLASGFCPRYGAGAHQGVAPTPIVLAAVACPNELG